MISSTVIILDVSSEMLAPMVPVDNWNANVRSKLQLCVEVIQEISLFLSYHHEWESLSLYVSAGSYRQIIPFLPPTSFKEQLNKELPEWVKENVPLVQNQASYPAMVAAARDGIRRAGQQSCVIAFTSAALQRTDLEVLNLYPPRYIHGYFLPLPFNSTMFCVDIQQSECVKVELDTCSVPCVVSIVHRGITTFRLEVPNGSVDPVSISSVICQKIYEPWSGRLKFDGMNEEACYLFPNPWGLRGMYPNQPAPAKLQVDTTESPARRSRDGMGICRAIPTIIAPRFWRMASQWDRSYSLAHPEMWNPSRSYGKTPSDFLGRLLKSKSFRKKGGTLTVKASEGFSGFLHVMEMNADEEPHSGSSDDDMSVHKRYSVILEYIPSGEKTSAGGETESSGGKDAARSAPLRTKQDFQTIPDCFASALGGNSQRRKRTPSDILLSRFFFHLTRAQASGLFSLVFYHDVPTTRKMLFQKGSQSALHHVPRSDRPRSTNNSLPGLQRDCSGSLRSRPNSSRVSGTPSNSEVKPRRHERSLSSARQPARQTTHLLRGGLLAQLKKSFAFHDFFVAGFPRNAHAAEVAKRLENSGLKDHLRYVDMLGLKRGFIGDCARISVWRAGVEDFLGDQVLDDRFKVLTWRWEAGRHNLHQTRGATSRWKKC